MRKQAGLPRPRQRTAGIAWQATNWGLSVALSASQLISYLLPSYSLGPLCGLWNAGQVAGGGRHGYCAEHSTGGACAATTLAEVVMG